MSAVDHRQAHTITRRVAGTPAEVAKTVAMLRNSRRLVAMTLPGHGTDDRVFVDVTVLAPQLASDSPSSKRRVAPRPTPVHSPPGGRRVAVAAGLLVAGIAAAAAGLVYAVRLLLADLRGLNVSAATVASGLFLAWLLFSVRRGHACRGLHCSGCRGHR